MSARDSNIDDKEKRDEEDRDQSSYSYKDFDTRIMSIL